MYVALTSDDPFQICVSLNSVKAYFRKAELFITNIQLPKGTNRFKEPDYENVDYANDQLVVEHIMGASARGDFVKSRIIIDQYAGNRFLSKLALAIGYNLLGKEFVETDYATELRKAFREVNLDKRKKLEVRGSGYLSGMNFNGAEKIVGWPGGWVLMLKKVENSLGLTITNSNWKINERADNQ